MFFTGLGSILKSSVNTILIKHKLVSYNYDENIIL